MYVCNAHLKSPKSSAPITATLIDKPADRTPVIRALAGVRGDVVERTIVNKMTELCDSYRMGSWHAYALSNGGFFMMPNPQKNRIIPISCDSLPETHVSPETAGLIASATAYIHLAFNDDHVIFGTAYNLLCDFIFQHSDVEVIRAALH